MACTHLADRWMAKHTLTLRRLADALCPRFLQGHWERLQASPLGMRFARGVFWSLAGAILSRGLALLSSIIVARLLGKEGFGELGIIQSTVGMFGTFAGFGLGVTATKYLAEFRAKDPQKAGRIVALSGVVSWATAGLGSVALVLSAPWLAEHTLAAPHLTPLLQWSAGLLFLSVVNGTQTGALSGFEAFRSIAWVNLVSGLLSFPLLVLGTWACGLPGAVWALTLGTAVNWALSHWALRKEARSGGVPLSMRGWAEEKDILWRFSLPLMLSITMLVPVNWLCNAILVNQPNGYAEMGILNAAMQWRALVLFAPTWAGMIGLPILSDLAARDADAARRVFRMNVALASAAAAVAALPLMLLSPWLMQAYGPGFGQGHTVLVVVLVGTLFLAFLNVVGQLLIAAERMWDGLVFAIIQGLATLGATWAFRHYLALGVAGGQLVAWVLEGALLMSYIHLLGMRFYRNGSQRCASRTS